MNDESVLREYLDAMLAASGSPEVEHSSDPEAKAASLVSRLERVEKCQELLNFVWKKGAHPDAKANPGNSWVAGGGASNPGQPIESEHPQPESPSVGTRQQSEGECDLEMLGRFQIRRLLGRGGMGVVFLAYDPMLGREVALKIPHPGVLLQPEAKKRFLRESHIAGRLDHPHLAATYEAGEVDGICYIASAYCAGPTLANWLRDGPPPVPVGIAVSLVAELAGAVQYAHERGVVHRDLKPSNVLLSPLANGMDKEAIPGFPYAPQITDFGLAGVDDDLSITATGVILGTAKYMSPEQASGQRELIGPPTDIHALGVVLYEVLCGVSPFEQATIGASLNAVIHAEPAPLRHSRPAVSRDLEAICLKCLAKEPSARYHSAAELREDLLRLLSNQPTLARPLSGIERTVRWSKRRPTAAGLAVVSCLFVLGLVGGLSLHLREVKKYSAATVAALDAVREEHRQVVKALQAAEEAHKSTTRQKEIADKNLARAQASEYRARRMSYRSDMQRAFVHWHNHRLNEVGRILEQQLSADGQPSLLGVEWRMLMTELTARWQVLGKHDGPATECLLTPDERRIVSVGEDGVIRVWDLQTKSLVTTFEPEIGPIHAAAVSPDGTLLAVGGTPSQKTSDLAYVYLLDLHSGKIIRSLQEHETTIESIAFSPDGRLLAAGSRYSVVKVSTVAGKELHSFPASRRNRTITFSDDNAYLMTLYDEGDNSDNRMVRIWDLAKGACHFEVLSNQTHELAWSPSGDEIVTVGYGDSTITRLDAVTGKLLGRLTVPESAPREMACFAFTQNGTLLVGADVGGTVHCWSRGADGGSQPPIADRWQYVGSYTVHDGVIFRVVVSRHGTIVVACDDGSVKTFTPDIAVVTDVIPQSELVDVGAVRDDGQTALSIGPDGLLRRWDVGDRRPTVVGELNGGPITAMALAANAPRLATIDVDGGISVFNTRPHEVSWSPAVELLDPPDRERDSRVSLSADGGVLAAWRPDDVLRIWNVPARKLVMATPQSNVRAMALSQDGRFVAYGGTFETVYVRSLESEAIVGSHPAGGRTNCVQFSPDGTTLATGHWDGSVRLLDLSGDQPLRVLRGHRLPVRQVAFSTDGKTLLSLGSPRRTDSIRLWDVESGEAYGALDLPVPSDTPLHRLTCTPHRVSVLYGDPGGLGLLTWDFAQLVERN